MNPAAKSISSYLLLASVTSCLPLQAATDARVREIELDEHQVTSIPVSSTRVTTVSFPGTITAIDGAMISTGTKADGLFQLAHLAGSPFFSVRTLVPHSETNVNVRWNQKTYILELRDSPEPVLSLIFRPPPDPSRTALSQSAPSVTPAGLLGLLDKAKAFPLLKLGAADSIRDLGHRAFAADEALSDFAEFQLQPLEVFRFEAQDTLVFHVKLTNKTEHEIKYRPDGFAVRVDAELYGQSVSDASGIIPAQGETEAFFAITGTPTGGRNDLSLKNEFTVLLDCPRATTPSRSSITTPKTNEGPSK